MKSGAILLHPIQEGNHPFGSAYPPCICCVPISHLVAISVIRLTVIGSQCLCSGEPLFYLMASEHKSTNTGNSDIPKRSRKVLPLSEKVKVFNKERKKKCMLRLLRSTVKMNLLFVKLWRREKMCASFAVTPETAKVRATVGNKCLVKVEKALSLWVEDTNRKHILIDGCMLHQKTLNPCTDFSKGSLKMSDTK